MKSMKTAALIGAVVAAATLATTPAFAWVCTAKNARGALYSAVGVFSAPTQARAIAKCRANSAAPNSCVIVSCK